jgi:hypothetical protein
MPAKATLKAKFDFEARDGEEMSFKSGEIIYLLFKDESGWAKGRKETGEKGWFPFDYTEVISEEETKEQNSPLESPSTTATDVLTPQLGDLSISSVQDEIRKKV